MKLKSTSLLFIILLFTGIEMQSQVVRIQVEPWDAGMLEANGIADCFIQNNGYINVCDSLDSGQNTDCSDCTIGGSEEVDVTVMWRVGTNTSTNFYLNDEICGYRPLQSDNGDTLAIDGIANLNDIIQIRLSGAEDDAGICASDLSGANDGQCLKSPYTNNFDELNDPSSGTYNLPIYAWCPTNWSTVLTTNIDNCASDDATNDYRARWRFRYHYVSGFVGGQLSGSDVSVCETFDPPELTVNGFSSCPIGVNWQFRENENLWIDIGGATGQFFNPPPLSGPSINEYRVRFAYNTSFDNEVGIAYSNVRRYEVGIISTKTVNASTCNIGDIGVSIDTFTNVVGCDSIVTTNTEYIGAIAAFTFSQNANVVEFQNASTNAEGYVWNFGDGTTSTDESPQHIYQEPGSYLVILNALNKACGADVSIDTIVVTITGTSLLYSLDEISLFPNPSNGAFTVRLASEQSGLLQFELIDLQGRLVDKRESYLIGRLTENYHLEHLPKGVYFLKIISGNEHTVMKVNIAGY